MTKQEIIAVFKLASLQGGAREQIEDFNELYIQALASYAKLSPSQQREIDVMVQGGRDGTR